MSDQSWCDSLTQTVLRLSNNAAPDPPRLAVVGLGHEMRGDDGAGVAIARLLQLSQAPDSSFMVIDAGLAPENQIGPLRRFGPAWVLLIDAVQMDATPGAVCWLDWQATTGFSPSTHRLPPHVLARYVIQELRCEVALLGIQPKNTAIGAPLSIGVWQAIARVTEDLETCLARMATPLIMA